MIIVICHHKSTHPFLKDLLSSIRGVKYKRLIIENETEKSKYIPNIGGYELGAIQKAMTLIDDDIFFLQDTTVIKDKWIFKIADKAKGGMALCEKFMSYMGKYKMEVLKQMVLPTVYSKNDSLKYEFSWTEEYIRKDPHFEYAPQALQDTDIFIEKHGRKNMVLENDYIIKYKAKWC